MPVQLEGSIAIDLKACKLIANSAMPYSAPNDFSIVDKAAFTSAGVIPVIASPSLMSPDVIPFLPEVSISSPLVLSFIAASSPATPSVITAKSFSDMPPFPLSHPRILYSNELIGASIASGVSNASNTLNPATYSRATFVADAVQRTITYTLSGNRDIDCVCIAAHNFADIGATVLVQWSPDTSGGLISFSDEQTPTIENGAMMFVRSAPVNARRIHIRINTPSAPGFIGVVMAGMALQMQHPIYGGVNPITLNRVTDYFNNRSESGEWLGRQIRRRGLQSSVSFDRLTAPWYRQYFDPFVKVAREKPFFFAWRPSEYPTEIAYCWTDGDIRPSNSGGGTDHISVSLDLEAHG